MKNRFVIRKGGQVLTKKYSEPREAIRTLTNIHKTLTNDNLTYYLDDTVTCQTLFILDKSGLLVTLYTNECLKGGSN